MWFVMSCDFHAFLLLGQNFSVQHIRACIACRILKKKKSGIETKCFCFGISSVYFLKCEYRAQKRFPIELVVITQPCVAVELRDTFSSDTDPCGSSHLGGEYWFILANGCTEVLGGLCQSC